MYTEKYVFMKMYDYLEFYFNARPLEGILLSLL